MAGACWVGPLNSGRIKQPPKDSEKRAGIRRHWWLLREAWSHAGEDVLCCEPNQLRWLDVDEERVRHDRVLLGHIVEHTFRVARFIRPEDALKADSPFHN